MAVNVRKNAEGGGWLDGAAFQWVCAILAATSFIGGAIVIWTYRGADGFLPDDMAAFGDFSAGSTLVFLTIAAFIYIRRTFKEQAKQVEIAQRQEFQSHFFTLFQAHKTLVENIEEDDAHGPAAFKKWFEQIKADYDPFQGVNGSLRKISLENFTLSLRIYSRSYEKNQTYLGHYFRSLYNVFRFIDDNVNDGTATAEQGNFYARLMRAHISNYELPMLALNAAMKEGESFRKYIKKYDLLRHVPESLWLAERHKAEIEKILNGEPPPVFESTEQQVMDAMWASPDLADK